MITMVIGIAAPSVPPIISANANSKFASAQCPSVDMPLLHRAQPRRQGGIHMVNKSLTLRGSVESHAALAIYQFRAGPTIVALACYGALILWMVWHNAKRSGSVLLAISWSFIQSLASIAAVGAILSWLNASGILRYEKDHGNTP
jgi:hypothetical protein